ncbi:hypothetical protein ACFFIX_01705 [Metabacillus herbersteinensis]|uniref:Prepilin-type N-terminal cleavage/methylation domain-containing protein n=1 Tax=Metabacillus herbersteinensis TaxID=283816 RepID=A0ABV6G9G9_9BACI
MKNILSSNKGITLIEILASLLILSVILLTFLAFFTNAFNYNSINADKLKTVNIAREIETELKNHAAIRNIIINMKVGGTTSYNLSKLNPEYSGLNLKSNIQLVTKHDTDYFELQLYDPNYNVIVYIKSTQDYPDSENAPIISNSLYRMIIEVYDDRNILSKTYTYFNFK